MPDLSNINSSNIKVAKDLSLAEMLKIIYRGKVILLITVIVFVLSAFLFNNMVTPVYQSSVLLKKDKNEQENQQDDEIKDIVLHRSSDEIETEMEIVKTREVLSKVIDELRLYLTINKIDESSGQVLNINSLEVDYKQNFQNAIQAGKMPAFVNVKLTQPKSNYNLYIEKSDEHTFNIHSSINDSLFQSSKDSQTYSGNADTSAGSNKPPDESSPDSSSRHSFVTFNIPGVHIVIDWPDAVKGSRLYFDLDSYYSTVEKLQKEIKMEHIVKTDIFKISYMSESPFIARVVANTTAEKFRDTRIEQQKQSIRYSFNFVDKQLKDVWEKLKTAENNLSQFKSSRQITSIDENSRNLIDFLSNLEAEKIKTNLELSDNENKLSQMKVELQSKGYIDETYLTPTNLDQAGSPFSNLLRQLSDLEIQRVELMQKRKENHPDIIMIDQRIKQIKDKLTIYNQNTLTAYQILINSAKKKQSELNNLTEKYTRKIEALPPEESRLAEMLRQKSVYDKIFTLLLNQREEMRIAELSKLQDIIILDQAHLPTKPVYPRKALNLLAGLLAGLVFGLVGVIIKEVRDRRLVNADDVETGYKYPVFAIIPNYTKELRKKVKNAEEIQDRFVTLMENRDGYNESYRVLKAKLENRIRDRKKILFFTSCEEGTGKTSIVSNFAISLVKSNKKVLIIDCDLKKASLTRAFNIKTTASGLINYLSEEQFVPNIYSIMIDEKDGNSKTLNIIPSGGLSESSSDLLSSKKMEMLLSFLHSSPFEYILVDTPPVTRVVDVLELGKVIRNSLLVVKPQWTFKDSVEWGIKEMEQEKINICGIVINACDIKASSYRYRYGYGYGYSYSDKVV